MKTWLCNLFFKARDAEMRKMLEDAKREYARAKMHADEAERYKESLSVVDIVREQMQGFNPHLLETEDELMELLGDEDSLDSFLNEAKKLWDNEALPRILSYIERNQIIHSAREAATLEAINFGRATLNGVSLVREEVERLKTAFDERHAPKEEFDAHEAV